MGMITRVRGRLHSITKIDPQVKEEKIAETVCLLSVLFLLPYCGRGHAPLLLGLGGMWLATYSFLVLPVLISANYKYPVRWLRRLIQHSPAMLQQASGPVLQILRRIYRPIDRCERVFLKMSNLINMANQLIFFMMCDRVLLCGFTGNECPQKKIVLEWTKAVTFIVTVTFMLLVFGLEQGLQNYQPTALYTMMTWLYYMCTEKVFVEMFPAMLAFLRLERLEALEVLYAPVILKGCTVILSSIFVTGLIFLGHVRFAFVAFYLTVYLKGKDAAQNCLKELKAEQAVLSQFRYATEEELQEWDDICAVCLSTMSRARITPCHHLFHADCLRMCLNASQQCPISIGNRISWLICSCLDLISTSVNNFEHEYLKVPTVHTFLNQLLFFAMCDMVLGNNKTSLIGFTSLLFYYIITYFVQRIVDIVHRIKTPRTSQQYTFNSLAICIIKILLEWAKAVIAIICLKEQGLKPHPNVLYTAVTWFYYMSTEPLYSQAFPRVLKVFHLELFDGLETLYAPVILEGVAILTSLSLVSIVFCTNKIFAMVCLYHSVVLRFKHMRTTYWNSLQNERHFLNSCRVATALEIANWNDICAVCLSDMKTARITSCGHYFHGECLRNCLRTSNQCPLCKTELHISVSDE
ncbi:TRC8 ring finger protein [Carabus blaptoides fortunei]